MSKKCLLIFLWFGSFLYAMNVPLSLKRIPFEIIKYHIIAELPSICLTAEECTTALSFLGSVNKKLFLLGKDGSYVAAIVKKMVTQYQMNAAQLVRKIKNPAAGDYFLYGKWLISHAAVYDNWGQDTLTSLKPYKNINIILNRGIDINFFDTDANDNALSMAVSMKNVSMIRFLLKKGACPYQKMNNGLTVVKKVEGNLKWATHPESIKVLEEIKELFEAIPRPPKKRAKALATIKT